MSTQTFNRVVIFEVLECCECGAPFAMTQGYYRVVRRDGTWFYCPAGHKQHFSESEADRLRAELERQEEMLKRARRARDQWREDYDRERRGHSATKGQLTKTRKRVGNGVCPCCNRTFANVTRHMTTKHPEYKEGGEASLPT